MLFERMPRKLTCKQNSVANEQMIVNAKIGHTANAPSKQSHIPDVKWRQVLKTHIYC